MPTPRYEREIRAMLDRMPDFLSDGPSSVRRPPRGGRPAGRRPAFQPGWAGDAYAIAALLTVLAHFGQPALGPVGTHVVAWVAAALVVVAVVAGIARATSGPRRPVVWRGNVIEYPGRSVADRLGAWWRHLTMSRRSHRPS